MDACFEYLDGEDSLATPDAKDEVDSLLHWRDHNGSAPLDKLAR